MSKQANLFSYKKFSQIKSEDDLRFLVKETFFYNYLISVEDERVDFLVYSEHANLYTEPFLWAETKDQPTDIDAMFTQLILTIKKKIDAGELPPKYLGVFDKEKIAFTEYHHVLPIFNLNDFDWKERPSSVSKKTIKIAAKYLENIVCFDFEKDTKELMEFIAKNFVTDNINMSKAQINKNNFVTIYNKWIKEVFPSISLSGNDWKDLKKKGVSDCDFYLADLLSENNKTISDKLNIVLQYSYYASRIKFDDKMKFYYEKIDFRDKGESHAKFWAKYERPPKKEYHQHIIERRDLLVPQDVRERKGAYFTPSLWVEKSQEYLVKVFGENWQDEYYIWDCCAGTCNLLAGLTNKYHLWASTLDQPDVDIVHENIETNSFNLIKSHVFRFDFLNDSFDKLPKGLRDIIEDKEKQKKLIIYINPPYAESGNKATMISRGKNKSRVANSKVYDFFQEKVGTAVRERFAQFILQIYHKMPEAKLAMFSKLKHISAPNFIKFREYFKAEYKGGFICQANTFDNVKGKFPIGFLIWDLANKKTIKQIKTDILLNDAQLTTSRKKGTKKFYTYNKNEFSIDWLRHFFDKEGECIGFMRLHRNDMQNKDAVYITSQPKESDLKKREITNITKNNLLEMSIYLSIRQVFESTWLNDRDQFLYPNDSYKNDTEFQNDCLILTLFHHQNRICSKDGVNHWIPFTVQEIDAKDNFQSTWMSDFLKSRKKLSSESQAVFKAGKALWKYYHQTIRFDDKALIDVALYEIREYFKGRNEKGKMKTKSTDQQFNSLDFELRSALKQLANKIQPKVYEYVFLKK